MRNELDQIKRINSWLDYLEPKPKDIIEILKSLKSKYKIIQIDFYYFDENLAEKAGEEKIKAVKDGKYDNASEWRNLELECYEVIEIKDSLEIEKQKSELLIEDGKLVFHNFGNNSRDMELKRIFHDLKKSAD